MRTGHIILGLVVLSLACGAAEPAPTEPEPAESQEPAEPTAPEAAPEGAPTSNAQARACLPVVNGCGCADRCEWGYQQDDGSWGVSRPLGDSALIPVRRATGVRTESGHIEVVPLGANPVPDRMIEVFFEDPLCGGECAPDPRFFACAETEDGCQPAGTP